MWFVHARCRFIASCAPFLERAKGHHPLARRPTTSGLFFQEHRLLGARAQEHPFRIVAVEVLIELSTFSGASADNLGKHFEFRPDLVCTTGDQRSMVNVRDWDKPEVLDEALDAMHATHQLAEAAAWERRASAPGAFL